MSKIYEALLRAEIDRLNAVQTNGNGNGNGNGPSTSQQAVAPKTPWQALQSPTPEWTPPPVATAVEEVPMMLPGMIDLSSVPQSEWAPSELSLPSLLSRGAPVEQFRGLRARMQEIRKNMTLRSLLVSSGLPGEGKSYVASNLAISMARYKNTRVLLIDGDMRRGTQHKLLGTRNSPGLTEYLSGKASAVEVMQRPAYTEIEGSTLRAVSSLTFIPCGEDAEKAADLSGNGRFQKLLDEVYPLFDWVVIDSSPVNLVADGANLGRVCDGVLLVTRSGTTKYETAQRAVSEFKASNVVGVVLNAVVKSTNVGGYYGYDSY